MQFHLPINAIVPDKSAPKAAPAVVSDYIIITLVICSSSSQPYFFPYAAEAVFHEPIIYPNCIDPILIVNRSDSR